MILIQILTQHDYSLKKHALFDNSMIKQINHKTGYMYLVIKIHAF